MWTLARQFERTRPDVTCIVWTVHPAPLYLWAGMEYKIPGFLDKAMPIEELLYWFDHALNQRAAWPGPFIAQAREWDRQVMARLRALTQDHWLLWIRLLHGENNRELGARLGWSQRTIQRRLTELYTQLGVACRSETICRAWEWDLVKARAGSLEWSPIIREFFPLSSAQQPLRAEPAI